jgi:hypothetical protein
MTTWMTVRMPADLKRDPQISPAYRSGASSDTIRQVVDMERQGARTVSIHGELDSNTQPMKATPKFGPTPITSVVIELTLEEAETLRRGVTSIHWSPVKDKLQNLLTEVLGIYKHPLDTARPPRCNRCKTMVATLVRVTEVVWRNTMLYRRHKLLNIDLGNDEWVGVLFKHHPFSKPAFDASLCKRFLNGTTTCEVWMLNATNKAPSRMATTGKGLAKFPDPFCKALGRRQSLTAALRKTQRLPDPMKPNEFMDAPIFNRREREIIWREYWRSLEATPNPYHAPIVPLADVSGLPMQE